MEQEDGVLALLEQCTPEPASSEIYIQNASNESEVQLMEENIQDLAETRTLRIERSETVVRKRILPSTLLQRKDSEDERQARPPCVSDELFIVNISVEVC